MIALIWLTVIGFCTYSNYRQKGLMAAAFYFVAVSIVQWIIITGRLPWYCWLALLFGISWVLSSWEIKSNDAT